MKKLRAFISYSHQDWEWLSNQEQHRQFSLLDTLSNVFSDEVDFWFDEDRANGLTAADEWMPKIKAEIDNSDIALVLLSQSFAYSKFIRETELPWILARRQANPNFPIVTIRLDPFPEYPLPHIANLHKFQIVPKEPLRKFWKTNHYQWLLHLNKIVDDFRKVIEKARDPQYPTSPAVASSIFRPEEDPDPEKPTGKTIREYAEKETEIYSGGPMRASHGGTLVDHESNYDKPARAPSPPVPPVKSSRTDLVFQTIPVGTHRHGVDRARLDRILRATGLSEDQLTLSRSDLDLWPLASYAISKLPVTRKAFKAFLSESGYEQWAGRSWSTLDPSAELPMTDVSWDDAQAFCAFYGLRLPTLMEWEYALSGGDDRVYPWGDSYEPNLCNSAELQRGLLPVGAFPLNVSRWGVLDMAGNVWQLLDAGQSEGERALKYAVGGSYEDDCQFSAIVPLSKYLAYPDLRESTFGFRVCQSDRPDTAAKPVFVQVPGGALEAGCGPREYGLLATAVQAQVASQLRAQFSPRRVQVGSFEMTREPVTNLQYLEFVRAKNARPPSHWWDRARPSGRGNADELPFPAWMKHLPVVNVTLNEARAFARYAGGRLPTGDEWEWALRGGAGRLYPWGDRFEIFRCNTAEACLGRPNQSGEFPSAPGTELRDLCGNVCEMALGADDSSFQGRGGSWAMSCQVYGLSFAYITASINYSSAWVGFRVIRV